MTTIAPITPNLPQMAVQPEPTPRESREQQLRIDQVVRATVSEGGQARVWLNIGRQRFLAETEIPLQTGHNLTLQVSKTSPRLEFKVLNDPLGERIRQALHLLKDSWSLAELGRELSRPETAGAGSREAWVGFLALQSKALQDPAGGLVRLLARFGMDYEALLAQGEIGGALSTLKKLLEDGRKEAGNPEGGLGNKLEHFSSLFELWQLIRLKLSQQAVEFWPLPLPGTEQGFLVAERGEGDGSGEGDGGERPWRITVHLQLPGLGPLQIDFLRESSGLLLRFQCASPDQARLLAENEEELQRSVAALPLESVVFAVGAPAPATALVQLLAGDGVFDARV